MTFDSKAEAGVGAHLGAQGRGKGARTDLIGLSRPGALLQGASTKTAAMQSMAAVRKVLARAGAAQPTVVMSSLSGKSRLGT